MDNSVELIDSAEGGGKIRPERGDKQNAVRRKQTLAVGLSNAGWWREASRNSAFQSTAS